MSLNKYQAIFETYRFLRELLKDTTDGIIKWQLLEFLDRGWNNGWIISFVASRGNRTFVLERDRSSKYASKYGLWVTCTKSRLVIKDDNQIVLDECFTTEEDYVDVLGHSGQPGIDTLARKIIDMQRECLGLYWSIM